MKSERIAYRILVGLCLAALAGTAQAQQPPADPSKKVATAKKAPAKTEARGAKLASGQKQCRSKLPDGSRKTWTCGSDQPCCVNHTFNLYTCGSQLLKCF